MHARELAGKSSPAAKDWPGLLTNYGKYLGTHMGLETVVNTGDARKKAEIVDEACRRRSGNFSTEATTTVVLGARKGQPRTSDGVLR